MESERWEEAPPDLSADYRDTTSMRRRIPNTGRLPTTATLAALGVPLCLGALWPHRRSYVRTACTGRHGLVSPEGGMLSETRAGTPFLTIEVDVEKATRAKSTYPRALAVP